MTLRLTFPTLRGLHYATLLAVAASIAICASIVWIHKSQSNLLARSVESVDQFSQSRLDLARGFMHAVLGDADGPFDRAQGIALLNQAIEVMRDVRDQAGPVASGGVPSARSGGFDRAVEDFRSDLKAFTAAPGADAALEASLRISFSALDHEANQLDLENHRRLHGLQNDLAHRFAWAIALSAVLLAGLSGAVHVIGLRHARSLAALREAEDRLDAVVEHLAEGVILADGHGRILRWNQAAVIMHGMTGRDLMSQKASAFQAMFDLRALDGTPVEFEDWPINRAFRGETVRNVELRLKPAGGGWERVLSYNGALVHCASGLPLVFLSIADVTERRRSEDALRLFRELVDASQDAFQVIDASSGQLLDANAALSHMTGYSRSELLRARVSDLVPGMTEAAWPARAERIRAAGSIRGERMQRRKDGSEFPVEYTAGWVELDRRYIVVVLRDISQRRVAEQLLREERDKLVRLAEVAPIVILSFRLGPDGHVSFPYSSPKIRDIYDLEPAQLAVDGSPAAALWHPEDVPLLNETIELSRRSMSPWHCVFRVIHPRRGVIWIDGRSTPVSEPDGATVWHGFLNDVTETRRVESELRENERLLNETGDLARVGGWELDPRTGQGRWTGAVAKIHDLPSDVAPTAEPSLRCYPGDARARLEAALHAAIHQGTPYDLELPIVSATGQKKWVRTISRPQRVDGKVLRLSGAIQDITDRKQAEIRAEVQHATTLAIAETADLTAAARRILEVLCHSLEWDVGEIWLLDRHARRLRYLDLWSRPHLPAAEFAAVSRNLVSAPHEGLRGRVMQARELIWVPDVAEEDLFRRRAPAMRLGLRSAIGVPILFRGDAVGVIILFSTGGAKPDEGTRSTLAAVGAQLGQSFERRQLEAQVLQSQKLEAIGTLAGGIAHDFNNILSAIIGFAGIAQLDAQDNLAVRESLDDILMAARRATDLVRQILAFSRIQEGARKVIQLRHIVEEARKLLRASIPSTIEFESNLSPNTPPVLADPTQVHQVVMNLGTNAAHAMQGGTGRLQFMLEPSRVSEAFADAHPGLRAGLYATLSVIDTGHGMDAEMLGRIFDPFFTTKAPGEGTGLGLSVVHGIMQRHDGAIVVQSQPGSGTRFDLYFPAHDSGEVPDEDELAEHPRGQGQTILCVDDEEPLLRLTKRILEMLGYTVETASDPTVALASFAAAPDRYAAAIVDLTMPHMLGTELGKQMRGLRRDLPIILMTGFSGTLTREKALDAGFADLLLKPISVHQLSTVVADVVWRRPKGTTSGA